LAQTGNFYPHTRIAGFDATPYPFPLPPMTILNQRT
jgi:hypothetical protein